LFGRPEEIRFAETLPKTRSSRIMRRLLREIVTTHSVPGDVTALEDPGVVAKLAAQHDEDWRINHLTGRPRQVGRTPTSAAGPLPARKRSTNHTGSARQPIPP